MPNQFLLTGLGSISDRHRANLRNFFPNGKIHAISSSNNIKMRNIKNVDILYESHADLTHDYFDMIFICSPASLHLNDFEKLSEKSNVFFFEKPLFTDQQIQSPIIEQIRTSKKKIFVGYCLRFNESLNFFKKQIESGILGRLYNVNVTAGHDITQWRSSKNVANTVSVNRALGGGALLELSHELDYAMWIFGDINFQSAVINHFSTVAPEVETTVSVLGKCGNNCALSVNLDFISPIPKRFCYVSGEHGALEWDYIKNQVTHFAKNRIAVLYSKPFDANEMYVNQLTSFFYAKSSNRFDGATWEDGVNVVRLIKDIRSLNK